jgi:flagellar basal-body rod protein FlgF
MQNTLLIGLSRQVALGRELDVIANNIANINTTGFKAEGSVFEEFLDSNARADKTGNRVSFVRDRGTWHDLSAGPTDKTGNPLDVAIDGKAFLVVQTPAGERYTRNGSMKINAQGQLVTSEGSPVLGEAGPITFQPTDNQVSISADGTISVREGNSMTDSQRGKLRMVSVVNAQNLQKEGNSTFSIAGETPQPTSASRIMQGTIEKSNVRSVIEMTRMIEVTRSYTQIANMISQQADMQRSSLTKLAEVPN